MYFNIVNYHGYNREMADEPIALKDLDDEKEPSVFQLEPTAPLEIVKVPQQYDCDKFYREIKEKVTCGSDCSKLQSFYRAKAKDVKGLIYGYDADGNLVERSKGTVIKTIALPIYRPLNAEEIDDMEKKHQHAIALANRAVDEARSALYAMSQSVERDDSKMLRLNRMVMEADCKLCVTRFPLRYIAKEEGIKIRQLDFTQPTEKRGLPYNVAIIETRPFPLQEQYVRIGEPAPPPLVSVAEANSMMKEAAGIPVILFEGADSNEYGYLSMEWAVVLEYHSTTYESDSITYQSVHQAIYCELARLFGDKTRRLQFLQAKTADEIVYSLEDVRNPEQNREKWNEHLRKLIYEVNLLKFRRYPELAAKLLETKNAMIGAYEPGDRLIGIGIPIESTDSKDPANWGENVLGKALMNIRELLRSEQANPVEMGKKPSRASASAEPVPEASIGKKPSKPSKASASAKPPVAASVAASVPPIAASASKPSAASVAASAPPIAASASKPSKPSVAASAAAIPSMAIAKPSKPSVTAAPVAAPVAAPAAPIPVAAPLSASVSASVPVAAPEERRKPRVASKVQSRPPP
jgi:ribA/ribD-fused uncharacterized protein